tara:strand:- start:137 stop:340 length:204 start_codon:yes stop_codon:yes gene_type:complete
MEVTQIIGNSIVGIKKIVSEESNTITYSVTLFPVMIDFTIGTGWSYNEISIAVIPLIRMSVCCPSNE